MVDCKLYSRLVVEKRNPVKKSCSSEVRPELVPSVHFDVSIMYSTYFATFKSLHIHKNMSLWYLYNGLDNSNIILQLVIPRENGMSNRERKG